MTRGRLAGLLLPLLLTVATPASAQVRAWLDRERIHSGETVALNLETTAPVDAIDYRPLLQDFELAGQSVRRSVVFRDGRSTAQSLFSVGLRPRRGGTLVVPSLRVGNDRSQPLALQVDEPPVADARGGADVFVDASIQPAQPYVQQTAVVSVRVLHAVPLLSGQLELPPPDGASLQPLGEDRRWQEDRAGRRYEVVERRFLLTPERSGALTLPEARFNGLVLDADAGWFGTSRVPVAAASAPLRVQVRPIPADAPLPWLPLRRLALRFADPPPTTAQAGQALRVTVEAVADGATAAQLPPLEWPATAGADVFPEPAQREDAIVDGVARATVRRTFSIVPRAPGLLDLAAMQLRWWDAGSGTARVAALPPLHVAVAAAPGGDATAPPDATPAATGAPARAARWSPPARVVSFAVAAASVVLLLAVVAARTRRSRRTRAIATVNAPRQPGAGKGGPPDGPRPASPAAAKGLLDKALRDGDLAAIEAALPAAAGLPHAGLEAIIARVDPRQATALRELQRARWGAADRLATAAMLRTALAGGLRLAQTTSDAAPLLPPLYPPSPLPRD